MSTSSLTFFAIPELVNELGPFLNHHDLSQLIQVNHAINDNFQSLFWRSVDLQTQTRALRFLESPEAIRALARNSHHVQSLTASNDFLLYYMHGLCTRQYRDPSSEQPEAVLPQWLPKYTIHPNYSLSLPLFTHLTRFHCKVQKSRNSSDTDPQPILHLDPLHILWIISFHPALCRVIIDGVQLRNSAISLAFAQTISALGKLTHLELHLFNNYNVTPSDLEELFFSCPPSMESLKLFAEIRSSRGCLANDEEVSESDYKIERSLPEPRVDPLWRLKELRLPILVSPKGYSAESISSILEHCPALESWNALDFWFEEVNDAAAKAISLHRNLRHVTVPHQQYCHFIEAVLRSLIGLPQDQLETLRWLNPNTWDDALDITQQFLQRHSRSLREIRLEAFFSIDGKVVNAITSTCESLELLTIAMDSRYHSVSRIPPENLIMSEWVCHNLQHLELFVEVPEDDRSGQSDHDMGPASITCMEKDALGQLYRQIGLMTKLKILDLKRQDTYSGLNYYEVPLPRLLTLEDDENGAVGCLSMLAGLTNLRELRGSVRVDTSELSKRMGQQEIEWMAEHWPSLEVAEFLQDDYAKVPNFEIPAHLKWLQEQRPKLRLAIDRNHRLE